MVQENFHILLASVKHFDDIRVTHQFPQGRKIKVFRQRVDRHRLVTITELNQTKLRVIGALAHELGVNSEKRRLLKPRGNVT